MTFKLANISLNTASYSSLYMPYGLPDEMWDVGNVVCYGSGILSMLDVGDVCMLGMWDIGDMDVGNFWYWGCGMLGMWDVQYVVCRMWDMGCFQGSEMLIYKMPYDVFKFRRIAVLEFDKLLFPCLLWLSNRHI